MTDFSEATRVMEEIMRENEKATRVSVNLPRDEVDRLVVSELIRIRNAPVNKLRNMSHFDPVLRHYLTESEFQKYVIDGKEIEA